MRGWGFSPPYGKKMTKEMLKDYIKVLEIKYKIFLILFIIVSILFVGMTVFAFSEFEASKEVEYDIEYEAETGDGDNGVITQINDMTSSKDSNVLFICIAVVLCVFIVSAVVGVILYGKSKNESKKKNENNYKKEE